MGLIMNRREKKGEKGDPGATTADGVSYKDSNVEDALDELTKRMDDVQYTPDPNHFLYQQREYRGNGKYRKYRCIELGL